MKKKIISLFLAVVMIVGMLPLSVIPAFAEEPVEEISEGLPEENLDEAVLTSTQPDGSVKYLEYSYDTKMHELNCNEKTIDSYYLLTQDSKITTWDKPFIVVDGNVNYSDNYGEKIFVKGDVSLILLNGSNLYVNNCICVHKGNTLRIFAQAEEEGTATGVLTVEATEGNAGIGSLESRYQDRYGKFGCGTIVIHGGTISATGGNAQNSFGGAGIGSGSGQAPTNTKDADVLDSGSLIVYGGDVTAKGGFRAAGIGGGTYCNGGYFAIYGGSVTATGAGGGAGIGGGHGCGDGKNYKHDGKGGGEVAIYGGTVTATAGPRENSNSDELAFSIGAGENDAWIVDYGDPNRGQGTFYIQYSDYVRVYDNVQQKYMLDGFDRTKNWDKYYLGKHEKVSFTVVPNSNWPVEYQEYNVNTGCYETKVLTHNYARINSSLDDLDDGWYVAEGKGSYGGNNLGAGVSIKVRGDAHLILKNGCEINVGGGIVVPKKSSLSIYAQPGSSDGPLGILKTGEKARGAGIGGGEENGDADCGTVIIHGGDIEARGSNSSAAIGGYTGGKGGDIYIYGGDLDLQGGMRATNIGAGALGSDDGNLTLGKNIVLFDHEGNNQIKPRPTFGNSLLDRLNEDDYIWFYAVKMGTEKYVSMEYNAETGDCKPVSPEPTSGNGIYLNNYLVTDLREGWYISEGVNTADELTVSGNVKLLLKNDSNLTLYKGINVTAGSSLTIYAQSAKDGQKPGKLHIMNIVSVSERYVCNGIYGAGSLTIHGGTVTSEGETTVGNGGLCTTSSVTILGGTVTATGGDKSAGISSKNITIHGGTVTATGSDHAAGIGGNDQQSGDNITITGGTVTATGGEGASGIGGGYKGNGGNITITGGTVTATGGNYGAGIGGGYNGNGGVITINGGDVTASSFGNAAGIGGGSGASGGIININGGAVTATGGIDGAGIGGGSDGNGGTININGGIIKNAKGGDFAAGIGGGGDADSGIININGGTVTAMAGNYVTNAIGCGYRASGITINVKKGVFLQNEKGSLLQISEEKPTWADVLSGKSITFSVGKLKYLAFNEETGSFESVEVDDPIDLETGIAKWDNGTYLATGNVTFENVEVNGNVKLILTNGCKFVVTDVIKVPQGSSLTIYACSENYDEAGTLIVNESGNSSREGDAGIGGGGNVTIHGGNVISNGTAQGAGIGGGYETVDYKTVEYKGVVTIYGGNITATGGKQAAGIGGGAMGKGTVRIYGGKITAKGGNNGGAGIGGGYTGSCDILIKGGDITATGGDGSKSFFSTYKASPGIGRSGNGTGGTVTISGDNIHAIGGKGVTSSNIPDADAIMADEIILNPKELHALKLTAGSDTVEYPAKATVTLSGKSDIYLELVLKKNILSGEDGNTPTTPDNPSNPTNPSEPANPTNPTSPQTGDTGNMTLWVMLLALSSMGLVACIVLGKKKKP